MTRQTDALRVSRRDGGRRWSVFAGSKGLQAVVAANYLTTLLVGLLVVAGCGGQMDGTPIEQAQAYFDVNQWDKLIAASSEAIALHPENPAAYLLRGRAQHMAGRYDLAVADLTDAIRLDPQDPEAYYQRAHAYRALGQMDLKREDDLKGRELDSTYTHDFKRDGTLQHEPTLDTDAPESELAEETADRKSDGPDFDELTPSGTDSAPRRSVVEDMFGMPPDLLEQEQPRTPPTAASRTWAAPATPETRPPRREGLAGSNPVAGTAPRSKGAGAAGTTDRTGQSPAARKGAAGVPDRSVAGAARNQPAAVQPRGAAGAEGAAGAGATAATSQQNAGQYRNLHPYGPSSMRPTGLQQPQALIDPYGGLSSSRGRAATVGSPYIPPNRLPGGGVPRTAVPTGPTAPAPPGNRYDGGRGYGY